MENGLGAGLNGDGYDSYNFSPNRANGDQIGANGTGSTALYHHHGSRYGLGIGSRVGAADGKMNGLHGPKHKRGEMDRECKFILSLRFASMVRGDRHFVF